MAPTSISLALCYDGLPVHLDWEALIAPRGHAGVAHEPFTIN
jgi:hypothetical protein